jgi:hypothetical protein
LDGGIGPLELVGPCARYRVLKKKKKLSLVFVIEAADKNRKKNVNIQANKVLKDALTSKSNMYRRNYGKGSSSQAMK